MTMESENLEKESLNSIALGSSLSRSLRFRYRLGLSLIALLSMCAFFLSSTAIRNQQSSAKTINESGRQRMLSQRISLIAQQLAHGDLSSKTKPFLIGELNKSLELMLETHRNLSDAPFSSGEYKNMSAELRELYFKSESGVDHLMKEFSSAVNDFLEIAESSEVLSRNSDSATIESKSKILKARANEMAELSKSALLNALDAVVFRYQSESEEQIIRLRRMEFFVFCATLFLLLVELCFIFRPMDNALKTFLSALHLSSFQLSSNKSGAKFINESGRQRMLTQRVGLLALDLSNPRISPKMRESSLEELKNITDLLIETHVSLSSFGTKESDRSPRTQCRNLSRLYFDPEIGVDPLMKEFHLSVKEFVDMLESHSSDEERLVSLARSIAVFSKNQLLTALDRVVLYYQMEIEKPSHLNKLNIR